MDPTSPTEPPGNSKGSSAELNDLLGIISANSSAAEDLAQSPADQEKYLENLRLAIDRAKEIANEMSHPLSAPVVRAEAPSRPPNKPSTNSSARQTLLHIDDDPTTRELVAQILSDVGFTVISAASGFDGIDIFRRRPHEFALVIIDLVMPLMDGEETFSRLRDIRADIPVMMVTGFIQEERLERLKQLGLAGFVRKPIPPDELIANVRAILEFVKYSGGFVSGGI